MSPPGGRVTVAAATGNAHKLAELRRLLPGLDIVASADLEPGRGAWDVEETGETFFENAVLKALAVSRGLSALVDPSLASLPVLADDSGLCVDALAGRPGVHSARYGGPGLDDRARWELLLREMTAVPDVLRTAHYRAAVVLARHGSIVSAHEGTVSGRILREPRGSGGFGYDPIFLVEPFARTMAELTPAEKDSLSHRARALAPLRAALLAGESGA